MLFSKWGADGFLPGLANFRKGKAPRAEVKVVFLLWLRSSRRVPCVCILELIFLPAWAPAPGAVQWHEERAELVPTMIRFWPQCWEWQEMKNPNPVDQNCLPCNFFSLAALFLLMMFVITSQIILSYCHSHLALKVVIWSGGFLCSGDLCKK